MFKSKNKMHPRNVFRTQPDYIALAIKHKDFRMICKLELNGKVIPNYKNDNALRTLTETLLKEYFNLKIEIAPGNLIPTVPLRLNYILWLEDLLTKINVKDVKGIDIGCGSSCIYALLGAKKNWQMTALESNSVNLEYAKKNIEANNMQQLISLFAQPNKDVIFKNFFQTCPDDMKFHFSMCNPPFYNSSLSNPFNGTTRKSKKRPPPRNCTTGNMEELACPGGEVKFVERIVEESLLYSERIMIFSSMLGHKSSVSQVQEILKKIDIKHIATTEFHQGNTTRWCIAWSFSDNML
ncbi:U6 small nuclear RNA (adenine-(43)-N(6))-methyltransferase [Teleopsis dalmanni]|uniref:U6 small nuclear RNA (adenine-(43)-N(6))-methyltransferase n=1 Tax=Teleopsis dalmanni TaxID=139649 RepID=UPI0018CD3041|nr:U6 small nuclear RNA (adenine-(43)-N(6))-methyltransferase [Teleopsis dalmanni]